MRTKNTKMVSLAAIVLAAAACNSTAKVNAAGVTGGSPVSTQLPAKSNTGEPTPQRANSGRDGDPVSPVSTQLLHIDAHRALQYTGEMVFLGPRYLGSAGHDKALKYLKSRLTQDAVEEDTFTAETPVGKFPMTNLIAKFPGTKDGIIVIASHYDTNYPLRNTKFIGANDGACTSSLLLELANSLRRAGGKPRDGYSVWLLWTDGEEATVNWTPQDSLYGTKHLAQKWQQDGTAKKIKGLMVADMICDADLDIQRETKHATPWLEDMVLQAATDLGYQSHFFKTEMEIEDDHLPFAKIGVPVADVIDINYGYNGAYHHTTDDTMDKLSQRSVQISGDVLLRAVQLLDGR